jgi:hypothetical protein
MDMPLKIRSQGIVEKRKKIFLGTSMRQRNFIFIIEIQFVIFLWDEQGPHPAMARIFAGGIFSGAAELAAGRVFFRGA